MSRKSDLNQTSCKRPIAVIRIERQIDQMTDLHPHWYRRLLVFWLLTGPAVLVLSNFHNPDGFSFLPGPPPLTEGVYPTISWAVAVLLIWHPVILLPVALWPALKHRSAKRDMPQE